MIDDTMPGWANSWVLIGEDATGQTRRYLFTRQQGEDLTDAMHDMAADLGLTNHIIMRPWDVGAWRRRV